ncbi:MAG TPA: hypothetical protein GX505_03780 [Clostridiales bacterium]|nr:hypothetical protein [Clostridiales bacterium]
MAYKKCPRCSLNYIKDTDVLCKICLEEVGKALRSNDDEEEYDICPECGEHIIKAGEEMCYQCMLEHNKEENDIETDKQDDWDKLPEVEEEDQLFDEDEPEELTEIELEEEVFEDEE